MISEEKNSWNCPKHENKPKKFWSYVYFKIKTKHGLPDLVQTDNTGKPNGMTTDTIGKAEVLSDFFASVFTKEPSGNAPTTKTVYAKLGTVNNGNNEIHCEEKTGD